ncbi:MAG: DegT/DnrJ/EryC1/StrS family aminotransferase [Nanoarchaeota archaeon]
MPGWELLGKEEKEALNDIFERSNGVLYRSAFDVRRNHIFRVDDFEKEIAKKVNVKYTYCTSSGTSGLKAALVALGVKQGDEVITQSFTFIATVEAILELGAIPVITEIDRSLNMDPVDLRNKITSKTKVIIPVHMGGVAAKMDEIMLIAKRHNLKVLEDSCQAFGAVYNGKPVGTIGDMGIYSFDGGKIITTGEGGAIVTNDEKLFRGAREYCDHGHELNPNVPRGEDTRTIWGFNYKMNEMQGAVGLAQLKKMDYILGKQREHKKIIKDALREVKNIEFRELPDPEGDAGDTLFFFVENKDKAKLFAKMMKEKGLGTKNVPDAIDWHFAGTWTQIFHDFDEYKGKELSQVWKNSNDLLRRSIALPILVNWNAEDINRIIENLKEIANKVN